MDAYLWLWQEEKRMREMACCFTGHRDIPRGEMGKIAKRLEETILALYERNIVYFGAGGALGFDTLAAETVLRLREEENYKRLKLILVLPCYNQTRGWKAIDVAKYWEILSKANKVVFTSQAYTYACMHKRNRYLVDNSSVCMCYQTKPHGGTAFTVNYAKEKGLQVISVV